MDKGPPRMILAPARGMAGNGEGDMPRTPTKATIAAEESGLLERQRAFRTAADRVAVALAECRDVEAIALIGSVARPLWREVPRFAPYRQLRLPIAHECKDVDLAVWVSRIDGLEDLRRARSRAVGQIVAEQGHGPAVHEVEVFLLEPDTDRYLGRLCYFRQCPADKRDCFAPGCGRHRFLKQHDGFSFWPKAIAEGAAHPLYDRRGGGIVARAIDLPLTILDADQ
jgi:hypothetical protein